MAATSDHTITNLIAHRTEQVFETHKIIKIPGIENFSREELSKVCDAIQHSDKSTALDTDKLNSALLSLQEARALAPSTRIRSPTLPLDEDADGETNQWTGNKKLASTNDTAGSEHRVNAARKATATGPQKEKSEARSVPRKQHEAKYLEEKAGDSQKARQEKAHGLNSSSTTTLSVHQVDQPGHPNSQSNPPGRQV
ncbi:MAG: hypothetical protein Q9207_003714 [Kuettlingeria erythrocarpa]